jgi:hypothetical protein
VDRQRAAESQAPTVALLLMGRLPALVPDWSLVSPPLLAYCIFIILSTLRLDPRLSLLTGVFSAAGYPTLAAVTAVSLSAPIFIAHAMLLLAGRLLASAAAKQITGYLEGALREAELRGQMDRINHELELARDIQQGLLPKAPPEAGPLRVAGMNVPADQTGSDYYDWHELPDGRR